MINQAFKVKPEIINVNSNEPVFYPFSIKKIKCTGTCNNINDPYAKVCVLQELMKQDSQNRMKRVSANLDQMQAFVIINNVGMMINVDANIKN